MGNCRWLRAGCATHGPTTAPSVTLGAVSLLVGAVVVAMVVFVAVHAWPTFEHNGLSWLGSGGDLEHADRQHAGRERATRPPSAYHLRAWPLVYGTLLTTAIAVVLGARRSRCSPRSSSSSSPRARCAAWRSR